MPKTFAYSNKGGYWKTRYSFLPTHYSNLNREFYSYPVQTNSGTSDTAPKSMPWRHNAGNNCQYYGSTGISAVSVTFNDFVSNNKMYRSLSLEGSNNLTPSAVLRINNSNVATQVKTTNAIGFRDRGGILYSGLSGNQLRSNASIVTLGTIISTDVLSYNDGFMLLFFEMDWVRGAKAKLFRSTTQETGLFSVHGNGVLSKLLIMPSGVGSPAQVATWQTADTNVFNTTVGGTNAANFYGPNGFLVAYNFNEWAEEMDQPVPANGTEATNLFLDAYAEEVGTGPLFQGMTLIAMTPDVVNGGKPQGQFADMIISFGTNDYELYALNAYYEANTLDHSK